MNEISSTVNFKKSSWGLRVKFFLPIVLIIAIFSLYFRLFYLPSLINFSISISEKEIQKHIMSVEQALAPFILEGQLSNIYTVLDHLKKNHEEWVAIELFDDQKRSLYPLDPPIITESRFIRKLESSITVNDKEIGSIFIYHDQKQIINSITKQSNHLLLLFGIVFILFLAIIYLILQVIILKPIDHVINASSKVAEGDLNVQVEISEKNNDEISHMIRYFNFMVAQIKESRDFIELRNYELNETKKDLQNMNETLERIVEQRTQELEISRSQNEVNERLAALGEVTSGIAHEINNPLSIMDGQIRRLKDYFDDPDMTKNNYLELVDKIFSNIQRTAKIVHGIKMLSRDASNDPLSKINVVKVLHELQNLVTEKYKSRQVDFSIKYDGFEDDVPSEIFAISRESQLLQVLFNLVSNSQDAIYDFEEKWIKIICRKDKNLIYIRIIDSGKGIERNILNKIFNPFYTTKDVGRGTGIGLSISKKMIQEQGGSLYYELYEGNTCFKIILNCPASN